jgi:hypothetical protein
MRAIWRPDPVEDVDLVALCAQLAERMTPPVRFELAGAPRLCALAASADWTGD